MCEAKVHGHRDGATTELLKVVDGCNAHVWNFETLYEPSNKHAAPMGLEKVGCASAAMDMALLQSFSKSFVVAKRHGAAALHNLAEIVAQLRARQRRGVLQSYAAFPMARCYTEFQHPAEILITAWRRRGSSVVWRWLESVSWCMRLKCPSQGS